MAMSYDNYISYFVKYNRLKNGMTQEQLAEKAGVGLRFVRDLEQGKETLRMDKVNQVLSLFGYQMMPGAGRIKDPYEILVNHYNRKVNIHMKNKTVLAGALVDYIMENGEIKSWKFLPNPNSSEYNATKDQSLLETIEHRDIAEIENY